MKTLNPTLLALILASLSWTSWSQEPSTTSESSTNQKLLDNAKVSREQIEKANADKPVQQIRALGAGQNVTNTANLTDQEKQLSENYIHQGKANQIILEKCSGEMKAVCNGNEGNHKFLGMDPGLIKAVSQAYAVFSAVAGDSLGSISKGEAALKKEGLDEKSTADANANASNNASSTNANGNNNQAPATKDKDKKANDYCKYIPTATEGIATAMQMAKTKELAGEETGNGDTAQKDALLKAAKSHESRATMAQIQAAGWFGGAACYAVNAGIGQFAVDTNLAIKMGAATLLGAFYQSEVSANKGYADKTKAIANSLPGKGDCNPITDNLCYCSQPSTQNDPTYCLKGLHAKKIADTSYRIACTDSTLKVDPTCECEKTNNCFDRLLSTQSEGILDLGGLGYGTSPFSAVRSLARGELVGGTLGTGAYDKTAAIARKGLRDIASKLPGNSDLNKDQKAMVDSVMGRGIPANVASLLAGSRPSSAALSAAAEKLAGAGPQPKIAAVKGSNIVEFGGGNGLGYKGNVKASTEDILAKLKPGAKGPVNSKILEFAQKAENQARQNGQIRQGDDTALFDIISMRYQTSGRRLLEIPSN